MQREVLTYKCVFVLPGFSISHFWTVGGAPRDSVAQGRPFLFQFVLKE